MRDRTSDQEHIDRLTSASICNAIGERLRQNFRPDPSGLPSHLQNLLDQMEQQDRQASRDDRGA